MENQQPTTKSYYQERMDLLGITPELNQIGLWQTNTKVQPHERELVEVDIFRETERGIEILVYTLTRSRVNYAKEGSRWKNKEYCITRLKDPKVKADGSVQKYDMPKGQPVLPFFPPALVEKYERKEKISVLYITEGYFKAFKAQMHGIDCVGVPSITCLKEKETGQLHSDITNLILECKVERVVWLTDGDCRDITTKEIVDGTDLSRRPQQFYTTVSRFNELTSNLEVSKYFAYINTNTLDGHPKGLDDLLIEFKDDIEGIVREATASFHIVKNSANVGTYFTRMNISAGVGSVYKHFLLDNVETFYLHHVEIRKELEGKSFRFLGTLYRYDPDKGKCNIEIPREATDYFRVGDKYYEHIRVPDKYAELIKTFHSRQKETIKDDHGAKILKDIPKYKAFAIVPNHVSYQRVIHNCFNLYNPFEHEVEEGECTSTLSFLKHIFGSDKIRLPGTDREIERWELGLDYLTLLYKRPQQILPILCLVSNERQTGKTTFAKWLQMLFNENMAIVGNEDLAGQFNAHWSSKLIICCDETKIDKMVVMEKIKSLSTAGRIMMNAKGRDQVSMEFFGKFILLSNNEDNFATIDKEEIRFWVIKVPRIPGALDPDMEKNQLLDEIPAFLHLLSTRQMIAEYKERHWFDTRLLKTDALDRIVANSRPSIEKQLQIAITELFEMGDYDEITMTLDAVTKDLLRGKGYDKEYVRRSLHSMGYKTIEPGRRWYPRPYEFVDVGGRRVGIEKIHFHNRYYQFMRKDFTTAPPVTDDDQPGEDLPAARNNHAPETANNSNPTLIF